MNAPLPTPAKDRRGHVALLTMGKVAAGIMLSGPQAEGRGEKANRRDTEHAKTRRESFWGVLDTE